MTWAAVDDSSGEQFHAPLLQFDMHEQVSGPAGAVKSTPHVGYRSGSSQVLRTAVCVTGGTVRQCTPPYESHVDVHV
jgi:hypothetical protein